MKEEKKSFLLFFLFLEKERKKERGWGEGGMGPVPFFYGRHSYLSAVRNYRPGRWERKGLGLPIPIRPHKETAGVIGSILPS